MSRASTARQKLVHVGLAVVVLAGGLLVNHVERHALIFRPFVTTGEVGELVPVWPGVVTVHGARAAETVETPFDGPAGTDGVWVAVDLSIAGGDQPGPFAEVHLVDAAGREFAVARRASTDNLGSPQPASPIRGELVYEVPEDALGRLTVVVRGRSDARLGGEARIPVVVDEVSSELLVPAPRELQEPLP